MKMTILLVLSAFFIVGGVAIAAKAKPPQELEAIFDHFEELEDQCESGSWEQAIVSVDQINKQYQAQAMAFRDLVGKECVKDTALFLMKLRQAVKNRDLEKVDEFSMELRKHFLNLMDNYDYKIPPALGMIAKYIDESREATEEGDYGDVMKEMDEIAEFIEQVSSRLNGKGVSDDDLKWYKLNLDKVRKAAKEKNKGKVLASLKDTEKMTREFMALYEK